MTAATPARQQALRDRALAKSIEQVRLNNLPQQVRVEGGQEVWSVHSRTTHRCTHCGAVEERDGAAEVHVVTVDLPTGHVACTCLANTACWHRTHVQRARAGEIGYHGLPPVRRAG